MPTLEILVQPMLLVQALIATLHYRVFAISTPPYPIHFLLCLEDGKLMADAETGEFWSFFGGFAPLPRRTATEDDKTPDAFPTKLLW